MRKTLGLIGILLVGQVFYATALFAEHPLQLRIQLFARAAVAELMRMRALSTRWQVEDPGAKISVMEAKLKAVEDKVDIFVNLNHQRKQEAVRAFAEDLRHKCCRLARGESREGGGAGQGLNRGQEKKLGNGNNGLRGFGQGQGRGGGGGGGRRRGGQ